MDKQKIVAIVEDDEDQRRNYADAITRTGYSVVEYGSKPAAMSGFENELPNLAVLDIRLGIEADAGFDLCRYLLQKAPNMPVIFLTERITEIDKISGLRMGAWDYLPKPISLEFLVERIASLLRINEARITRGTDTLRSKSIGDLLIDHEILLVSWKGKRIDLSGTEFRMLTCLVNEPNSAVSYAKLKETTKHAIVTNNTINTHIRNIRQKFEEIDSEFASIASEYGWGYRWTL